MTEIFIGGGSSETYLGKRVFTSNLEWGNVYNISYKNSNPTGNEWIFKSEHPFSIELKFNDENHSSIITPPFGLFKIYNCGGEFYDVFNHDTNEKIASFKVPYDHRYIQFGEVKKLIVTEITPLTN